MEQRFGLLLRSHRQALGLTQEALAQRAALSGQAVGALERGDRRFPHLETVRRLADGLGLTGEQRAIFLAATPSRRGTPRRTFPDVDAPHPRVLPPDTRGFVGRHVQLTQLDQLLTAAEPQPTAMMIVALSGTAGVGKTTLALHWAHRVHDQFPDGQLFVDLRGFDPLDSAALDPAEAVRLLLHSLRIPAHQTPPGVAAQLSLYRTVLADKRMLIVLDNARDATQVRPLLPGSSRCVVVVTSRNALTSLVATDGAHPLALDLLTVEESREMLSRRLGADRVAAETAAVGEIIDRCARLPLALAIVAAHAAIHPQFSLRAVAEQLHDADALFERVHGGDAVIDLRAVFSWSYRTLGQESARLFRLLGLHPGPAVSAAAAASLSGRSVQHTLSVLAELSRSHLLLEQVPGRYVVHDLLCAYASELAHTHDSDTDRRTALHRALDHYLHTAHAADRMVNPARDLVTLEPPQAQVTSVRHVTAEAALAWLTEENAVLIALVARAALTGFDTHAWQLAWVLATVLARGGRWHQLAAVQHTAATAADRLDDPKAQIKARCLLSQAHAELGRYSDAQGQLRHARNVADQSGDIAGQAHVLYLLAIMDERQDRRGESLDHAQQALHLFQAAGHHQGQASALNAIGWCHTLLGNHRLALNSCERALTLFQRIGDQDGESAAWDSLGHAHYGLGHHTNAVHCYQHALALIHDFGYPYRDANTLTRLGNAHQAADDPEAARDAWQRALAILTDLDHPDAARIRVKLAMLDTNTPNKPCFPSR